MTDSISRQAALKGLEDLNIASWYEYNEHSNEAYHEIKQMLETLPTVDAVPVRHGKWVLDVSLWYCSECGLSYSYNDYAFCPNCGARMDEKDGDHYEG